MDRCWILLGMMGAGKSSIGRALAEYAGREFFDTDLLLQSRLGRPIPQLFQVYGESTFRDHETSILRGLEPGPCVLATGGGIVLREENWAELRRLGTTIFLEAELPTLVSRLGKSKKRRPLLQAEDWEGRIESILAERQSLYRQADLTVSVDDIEVEAAAARLYDILQAVAP